jgi:hypothetical protein
METIMKIPKTLFISIALFLSATQVSMAGDGPTDTKAMTCNVVFQITKSFAKDPKIAADAERAANLFGAYLIKNGMKEPDFIALYDETFKKVQNSLEKGSESAWGKQVDACVEFADDL